jgi:hypothetical protein
MYITDCNQFITDNPFYFNLLNFMLKLGKTNIWKD